MRGGSDENHEPRGQTAGELAEIWIRDLQNKKGKSNP
jgi:hypothetical protein